jgi:ligand-binding sensor domain-containing protein/signal transduction histidine kinase
MNMLRAAVFRNLFLSALLMLAMRPATALDSSRTLRQCGEQAWQTSAGLPQNTVHAITQTKDGFLWIATEGGLARFDGTSFTVFDTQTTPQLRSDFLYNLMEDARGALWISTGDGLLRYADNRFREFRIADGLPSNIVWSTWQGHSGRFFALTSAGLAVLQGQHFTAISGTAGIVSDSGQQVLTEDAQGRLWLASARGLLSIGPGAGAAQMEHPFTESIGEVLALATDSTGHIWTGGRNGLAVFNSKSKSLTLIQQGLPSHTITALLANADGSMWVGTTKGLALFRHGVAVQAAATRALANARIARLYRDRADTLWITSDQGLARLVGSHLEQSRQFLAGNSVLSIFEDREGSMWFGTDSGGLHVLRAQKFSTLTAEDGLSNDFVRAVLQDRAGDIWMGTNGGGLDRLRDNKITTLRTANGLSSDIVLTLAATGDDLWAGTPDGLNRIRNGHIQVLTSADGLPDDFIRSLYADPDGSLWIGTRHGLAHLLRGNITLYTQANGLGSDVIGTVLRGRDGSLWIGTMGGLSRLRNGSITNYTTRDGLSSNIITTLFVDAHGDLWIGASNGGLNEFVDGKFRQFPAAVNALPETIYSILQDASGHLWLSSRKGIYRVSQQALTSYASGRSRSVPVISYGTADGMKISECSSGGYPAAWQMQNGSLWFATLKGIAFLNPGSAFENRVPPLVAIEQIEIDDHPIPTATAFTVAPGHSRITIHYAGLSFVAPQKVRFRYRLEGMDRNWIDAGGRRTAYYTNLAPGKYRFLVDAANNDGIWSSRPAEVSFRIQPRFYQTYWFYALILLALALLVYRGYRWRVHQVEKQYQAVLAERGRIAREIHDTLAQDFVGVSVQLELIARLLSTSIEAAREQLERTRELVRTSLAEARSSIWNLRSQGTTAETLPDRLTRLAEAAAAASQIKAKLHVHGTYRPFSRNNEDELVRIAQEAIHNTVRHAHASHVAIELHYDAKQLRMEIADDGRGFDELPQHFGPEGHFGIQGMRERAAKIGAQWNVESARGRGTRISVTADAQRLQGKD